MAVVPVDAAVEDVASVSLLDGRQVPAARLRVIRTELPEASISPDTTARSTASLQPSEALKGSKPRTWACGSTDSATAACGSIAGRAPICSAQLNTALRRPIDTVHLAMCWTWTRRCR